MKTILLTGASGFVGRHLVKYFNENYKNEYKLVLLTSKEIENEICVLHRGYTFTLDDFLKKGINHIDYLIHLGAFVGKTAKESASAINQYTTILNTVHLLENLPNIPEKLILISSVAVYGFDASLPYVSARFPITEDTETVPRQNYALAKLFCERIISEYAEKKQCVMQILRLGSTYGIDRDINRLGYLGYIMQSLKAKKTFHILADPKCKYNYIHVDDACKFIIKSVELNKYEGPINLVSSENISSLQMCELVQTITPTFDYVAVNREQYFGDDHWFDSSKRERLLGSEAFGLKSGLMQCIDL